MDERKNLFTPETVVPTEKEQSSLKPVNMSEYVKKTMKEDISHMTENGKIKSGFKNLDAIMTFYPGLYVIGAICSLGKTTFMNQISDQIAEAGHAVLFFSFEQSRLELAAKSLSRIMAKNEIDKPMTSLQIRRTLSDPRVETAAAEYEKYAGNIYIMECTFDTSITVIEKTVRSFIEREKRTPVVIVDYLQLISASEDSMGNKREVIDIVVHRFKQLQSDLNLVLILISALSRQNYYSPISFDSYKESGGIEYTADVLWGLQFSSIHTDNYEKTKDNSQKRTLLTHYMAEDPRKVELVCHKNRFGISSYRCSFDYHPQYDYFEPDMNGLNEETRKKMTDIDDYSNIPEYFKL